MDNASGSVVVAGICRSNNRFKLTLPFFVVCVSTVQEQRTLLEGYEKNNNNKKKRERGKTINRRGTLWGSAREERRHKKENKRAC